MKIRLSYSNDGIGAAVQLANIAGHGNARDVAAQTMRKFVKWYSISS